MKWYLVIIFIIIAEVIFLGANKPADHVEGERTGISVLRSHIQKEMKSGTSSEVYERLKDEYKNKVVSEAHFVLHIFGEFLYEKEKRQGIVVCDDALFYGCYHGFFSRAIATEGIGIIGDLSKSCGALKEYSLNCIHGIGHGIMEYKGHARLTEALKICEESLDHGESFFCAMGALMEYHFPLGENATSTRLLARNEYSKETPFGPCPSLPVSYQEVCYFNIAQWWRGVIPDNGKLMVQHCSALPDLNMRNDCYLGFGFQVPLYTKNKLSESINECNLIPSEEERKACFLGVSWGSYYSNKVLSKTMCDNYNRGEDISSCINLFKQFTSTKFP
jgi:hypothetical protein